MSKETTFTQSLKEIQEFLSNRKQLTALAEISGVGLNTVYDTFKSASFEDLKGKKIDVYRNAISMVEEIKSLPIKATEVAKK